MRRFSGTATLVAVLALPPVLAGQEAGYKGSLPRRAKSASLSPNKERRKLWEPWKRLNECCGWRSNFFVPMETICDTDMDVTWLKLGTDFIAMLRVQNVGKDSVQLPWLLDPQSLERPGPNGKYEYSDGSFIPSIRPGASFSSFQVPVRLYGSNDDPDSWISLEPGHWLELRVKLLLSCETALLGCKDLASGDLGVGFVRTESRHSVEYRKCSTASGSERRRYVASQVLVRDLDVSGARP